MRRRKLLLGLSLLCVIGASALVTLWALRPTPGVTQENVDRLRFGMSPARVVAILGQPEKRSSNSLAGSTMHWSRDTTKLRVVFTATDQSGRQALATVEISNDLSWPNLESRETLAAQILHWSGFE